MNDYDYLINQLSLLIGLIDVSEEEVYNQIKHHDQYALGITIEQLYEGQYSNYSNHITTAAYVLGFAHIEDFITKCITRILIAYPNTNEWKVTIKTIQEKGDGLITYIAEEQSKRLTFSDKIKFIEKNIQGIDAQILFEIKLSNDIRNCIMHNNGIADNRLSPKYPIGEKIVLTAWEINNYGLRARQFANEVWQKISSISITSV